MRNFCGTVLLRNIASATCNKGEHGMPIELTEALIGRFLREPETRMHIVEQEVRVALRFLWERSDNAQSKDDVGYDARDKRGDFVPSLISRSQPYTPRQLSAAYAMLCKYKKQLESAGIPLPAKESVQALVQERESASTQVGNLQTMGKRTKPFLDLRDNAFYFSFPFNNDSLRKIKDYKVEADKKRIRASYEGTTKEWRITPADEDAFTLFIDKKYFPLSVLELSPTAQEFKASIDRREEALIEREEALEVEARERYMTLLNSLGDLSRPIFGDTTLYRHQVQAVKMMLYKHRAIVGDQTGVGKAQPLDAKILTPHGWKTMGEIQAGDEVINSQGKTSHVVAVYPQGEKSIYRVTLTDGSYTECCDEHLWTVNTPVRKHCGNAPFTVALKDIMHNLRDVSGKHKYHVPMVKPIEFGEDEQLPLHPYVLGYLLGNGSMSTESFIHVSTQDEEAIKILRDLCPENTQITQRNTYDWAITGVHSGGKYGSNPVLNALRNLHLMGHLSVNKFIPQQYLYASYESREALLQGLLDADGYCDGRTNIEYSTSSPQLATQVAELVQSFGGKASLAWRTPHYTHNGEYREGQENCRINIALPVCVEPFRIERRKKTYKKKTKYHPTHAITSVEYVGEKEAQCILVDAPDHLYVTDHYILTHNTLEAGAVAKAFHNVYGYKVYVVTTKSNLDDWLILADNLQLPVEVISWGAVNQRGLGEETFSEPYIAIVDEAQNMCNMTAERTRKMLGWLDNATCKAVYLLTGTWMPNGRPINLYPLLLATHHPLVWSENPSIIEEKKKAYVKKFCGAKLKIVAGGRHVYDYTGATDLFQLNRHIMYVPGDKNNSKYANLIARLKIECKDLPPKVRIMQPVELSPKALKTFEQAVEKMFAEFERCTREKLELFVENWRSSHEENESMPEDLLENEEAKIRSAEAIVSYGIFRHAGAIAKIDTAIAMASVILDRGQKVVFYTNFTDVAKEVGRRIEKETGKKVGYILGEVSREERQRVKENFQRKDGDIQAVILTAAGSEAITLNAAQDMFVLDRPWTPGKTEQAEDRIHRINNTQKATIYWLQLPREVTTADIKVDALIQEKQKNIDMVRSGKVSAGMQFADNDSLKGNSLAVLQAARKELQQQRKA